MILLLNGLSESNPIFEAARLTMAGQPLPTLQPLLEILANPIASHWKERSVAAWTLGFIPLTPTQRAPVLASLNNVLAGHLPEDPWRIQRGFFRSILAAIPATLLLGCIFALRGVDLFEMLVIQLLMSLLMSAPGVPLSLIVDDNRVNRVRAAAATALGRQCAIEHPDTLVYAALGSSQQVRTAAIEALRLVLPALTDDHYGRIPRSVVPDLCRLSQAMAGPDLRPYFATSLDRSETLVLTVIEALHKIGDGRAIRPMERLAAKGYTVRIQQAAGELLPVLQARHRQENDPQVLLRASEAVVSADHLLRPAQGASEDAPQQLLRASASEEP